MEKQTRQPDIIAPARKVAGADGKLSTKQVADFVGRHVATVRFHAVEGRLPGVIKVSNNWRYPLYLADPKAYAELIGTTGRGARSYRERGKDAKAN